LAHLTYPEGGTRVRTTCLTIASFLVLLLAACGGPGGGSDLFGVQGGNTVVVNTPESPTGELRPLENRTGTINLADARRALRDLPGATASRRREIFDLILGMGPLALVEVDRAAATIVDDGAQLDLARLRMLLLEVEEANKVRTEAISAEGAGPPSLPNPDANSSTAASDTVLPADTSVPSDYGLSGFPGDGNYDATEVDKFVHSRLALAAKFREAGDSKQCVAICEALLLLAPSTRWRREVQQLLRDAKTGEQTVRHLAGTLRFDAGVVTFDASGSGALAEPLPFSIFLKNVGTRPVRMDLGDGKSSGRDSVLILEIEVSAEDSSGQVVTSKGQLSLRLTGAVMTLAPNEAVTLKESIKSLEGLASAAARRGVVSTVKASADLRPAALDVGLDEAGVGERSYRPVALVGGTATVLPSGFAVADARDKPITFMKQALENKAYDDVFLAAPLVGEEHRQACLDILLAANLAEGGIAEQQARIRAARTLSGENLGNSPSKWVDWWAKNRQRFAFRAR